MEKPLKNLIGSKREDTDPGPREILPRRRRTVNGDWKDAKRTDREALRLAGILKGIRSISKGQSDMESDSHS